MTTIAADRFLKRSGMAWYSVALIGQAAFIFFIVAFYVPRTFSGNFRGWNDKPLIDGYIEGDGLGNLMFILHVLGAAVITTSGLIQLMPALRNAFPALHRWSGRLFLFGAYLMASGGLMLTWARGTNFSFATGIPITIDALLIFLFATGAWILAVRGHIDSHRRWAMRTFMVVNGVWFLRIGMMAWAILAQGAGMSNTMSGPADFAIGYSAYLLPVTILQLYFVAQDSSGAAIKWLASGVLILATLFMAVGIVGAQLFMWGPYL